MEGPNGRTPRAVPRPPPPVSLTTTWDKAEWHADRGVPEGAAGEHIRAVMRVLSNHSMLTPEGEEEVASAGPELALLDEHVQPEARGFLDEVYATYLDASRPGQPAIELLTLQWERYIARFNLTKAQQPTSFEALLLRYAPLRTLDSLLRAVHVYPEVAEGLAQVVDEVPPDQQPLARIFVTARTGDLIALANTTNDPALLLHALRYLPDVSIAKERLRAAVILAKRLDAPKDHRRLELVAHAVNLVPAPAYELAVVGLAPDDRGILAGAVNALFTSNDFQERYLAICAMRTVGDERSLDLLRANPADVAEGTMQRSVNGHIVAEPASASVRREADEAIRARALTH